MCRGLKFVPMIVLVCVAPKAGPDASKAKTANRNVLLKVFIFFLSNGQSEQPGTLRGSARKCGFPYRFCPFEIVCSHTLVFSTVLTEWPSVVDNDVKRILSKLFTPIQGQGGRISLFLHVPQKRRRRDCLKIPSHIQPSIFPGTWATGSYIHDSQTVGLPWGQCHSVSRPWLHIQATPANEIARQFDAQCGTPDEQFELAIFLCPSEPRTSVSAPSDGGPGATHQSRGSLACDFPRKLAAAKVARACSGVRANKLNFSPSNLGCHCVRGNRPSVHCTDSSPLFSWSG